MKPDPVSIVDRTLLLFCPTDDALPPAEYPQATLEVSKLLIIGVLFGPKGGWFRRFYPWLVANLGGCFSHLPERSRPLLRANVRAVATVLTIGHVAQRI